MKGAEIMVPVICIFLSILFISSQSRKLEITDFTQLLHDLEDEILSHNGLSNTNTEETEIPRPLIVVNWGQTERFGQISGVSMTPNDEPVIFHRGPIRWNDKSFDEHHVLLTKEIIKEDTIFTLSPETGEILSSFGSHLFYMPHGLAIDRSGNTYVTDVGLHQVFRFPIGSKKPDLILGTAFLPGNDESTFCQPSTVSISESQEVFFVGDGYCNSRIVKYTTNGKLLDTHYDSNWNVIHSLAYFENDDVLCVGNREGQSIKCIGSGGRRPFGIEVLTVPNVGRVFGLVGSGKTLLGVSGPPNSKGFMIDTSGKEPAELVVWATFPDLSQPHDLAVSYHGDAIYVVEMDETKKDKLVKFEIDFSSSYTELEE